MGEARKRISNKITLSLYPTESVAMLFVSQGSDGAERQQPGGTLKRHSTRPSFGTTRINPRTMPPRIIFVQKCSDGTRAIVACQNDTFVVARVDDDDRAVQQPQRFSGPRARVQAMALAEGHAEKKNSL